MAAEEEEEEEEESGGTSEVGRGVVVAMDTSEEVGTIWGEREEGKVTGKGSEVSVCALPIRRRSGQWETKHTTDSKPRAHYQNVMRLMRTSTHGVDTLLLTYHH